MSKVRVADCLIFSTYVEVFLWMVVSYKVPRNFLHVCGGVSGLQPSALSVSVFSPRMWRSFLRCTRYVW